MSSRSERLLVGTLLALVTVAALSLHVLRLGTTAPLHPGLRDSFHAPGFIVLTIFAFALFKRHRSGWSPYVLTLALVGAIAILGELLQMLAGRDASFDDLGRDLVGTMSALGIGAAIGAGSRPARYAPLLVALIVVGLAGIYTSIRPMVSIVYALYQRSHSMPVLFDFEGRWQWQFIRSVGGAKLDFAVSEADAGDGKRTELLVQPIDRAKFSGVAFAPHRDWSGRRSLSLRIRGTAGAPFDVTVRVHDRTHNDTYADRYNHVFPIAAESSRITIPLDDIAGAPKNRRIDLSDIDEIIIFFTDATGREQLIVDDIELVEN